MELCALRLGFRAKSSVAADTSFGLAPSDNQGTLSWRREGETEVASLVEAGVSSGGGRETEAGAALGKACGEAPITGKVDQEPKSQEHFFISDPVKVGDMTEIYGDSLHTHVGR